MAKKELPKVETEKQELGILGFKETIMKMHEVHLSKNHDYATASGLNNPFYNFDATELILNLFKDNRDKVFVWPIANKLARLSVLLSSEEPANNETIQDSLIDIANYVIIWKCDLERR